MTTPILSGKSIVIVGAGGRLGGSLVRAILDAGANVAAVDTDTSRLASLDREFSEGGRLLTTAGTISEAASVTAALGKAAARFGTLDGAVNAAYPRNRNYGRAFLDVTYADFCENVSLHLGGYFLFMQQCMQYSIGQQASFSLVNLSSIYGVVAPRLRLYEGTTMTMPPEYAAIKAGLIHLTRYANACARGTRFRANCVSPGGIEAGQPASFLSRYAEECNRKGMLSARDVVGSVIFLLSDAAEFVLGQNIIVDDGFTL